LVKRVIRFDLDKKFLQAEDIKGLKWIDEIGDWTWIWHFFIIFFGGEYSHAGTRFSSQFWIKQTYVRFQKKGFVWTLNGPLNRPIMSLWSPPCHLNGTRGLV